MTLTAVLGLIVVVALAAWLERESVAALVEHLPPPPVIMSIIAGLLWVGGFHGYAVLAMTVGVAAYVFIIVVFPWVRCPPQLFLWGGCNGSGEQRAPFTKSFRTCPKCGGTKRVVRMGRRLWTSGTDVNEDRK